MDDMPGELYDHREIFNKEADATDVVEVGQRRIRGTIDSDDGDEVYAAKKVTRAQMDESSEDAEDDESGESGASDEEFVSDDNDEMEDVSDDGESEDAVATAKKRILTSEQ